MLAPIIPNLGEMYIAISSVPKLWEVYVSPSFMREKLDKSEITGQMLVGEDEGSFTVNDPCILQPQCLIINTHEQA